MPEELYRIYSVVVFESQAKVLGVLGYATITGVAARTALVTTAPPPNLLPYWPETPIRHTLQWPTDLIVAWDGTEQRIAVYGAPRESYELEFRFSSEERLREAAALLYRRLPEPLAVPLWHSPETLAAPASVGDSGLSTLSVYFDGLVGDQMLVVHESDEQKIEVVTFAGYNPSIGQLLIQEALEYDWPIGTLVIPIRTMHLPDGAGLKREIEHAGTLQIMATTRTRRALGGTDGTPMPVLGGLPILDEPQIARGDADEAIRYRSEVMDHGAVRVLYPGQPHPDVGGQRSFRINGRFEMQQWKLFLDTVKGRQGTFFVPSHRPDLVYVSSTPGYPSSGLTITDDGDYVGTRYPSLAMRSLMLRYPDGSSVPCSVSSATDNGDGTQLLVLSAYLPAGPPTRIELMPLTRLASDTVEIEHHHSYSLISMRLETTETR